jgi:hypothetical protein
MDALVDFPAVIVKVQTMADNSPRLTLDLPETALDAAGKLMLLQNDERYLHVVIYDAEEFLAAISNNK